MAAARLLPVGSSAQLESSPPLPGRIFSFTEDAVSKTLRARRRKQAARRSSYPNNSPLPCLLSSPTPRSPCTRRRRFVQQALFIGFAMNKALSIGQQGSGFASIGGCGSFCRGGNLVNK